jgi:hypothetical protein
MAGFRQTVAVVAGALVAALAVSGGAGAKSGCTAGLSTFAGAQARTFCGPARATLRYGGRTVHFSGGSCTSTSQYVTLNIGTIVVGRTSKKHPEYLGLDVGRLPGMTGKPAAADGQYTDVVLSFVHAGASGSMLSGRVTLSGHRTKGTLAGSLLTGGAVSGSFSC